jgi:hypothetical protein
MTSDKVRAHHLERKALLYVRQSSAHQVLHNRESSALQYAMRDRLTALGWSEIEVIDDDLGRSAAGSVQRAGFERMVAEVCLGKVGAVCAREVSRFAPAPSRPASGASGNRGACRESHRGPIGLRHRGLQSRPSLRRRQSLSAATVFRTSSGWRGSAIGGLAANGRGLEIRLAIPGVPSRRASSPSTTTVSGSARSGSAIARPPKLGKAPLTENCGPCYSAPATEITRPALRWTTWRSGRC